MNRNSNAVIIGAGHIGKSHALNSSKLFKKLYIIDPNKSALKWCRENIKSEVLLFESFEEFSFENKIEENNSLAIISNWGIDHHSAFFDVVKKNINKIYMEKPFSHSLNKINEISEYALKNNIKLASGFKLRHSNLAEEIKQICVNSLDGNPALITVEGGANCIVTNGIHFLDLACSVFNQEPDNVFSRVNKDNINPRGAHLGFWEGFASFGFNNNNLNISFSNNSSIRLSCKVYAKNGYLTISDKGDYVEIIAYKRNDEEIKNDSRITRTGLGFKLDNDPIIKHDISNAFENIVASLFDSKTHSDISRETLAAKGILAALISSEKEKLINLPINNNSSYYNKEWSVS